MTANEFFKSLVGLDITEARKKLGYWWVLETYQVDFRSGLSDIERADGGQVAVRTENNVIKSESHNIAAEIYQKRDLE